VNIKIKKCSILAIIIYFRNMNSPAADQQQGVERAIKCAGNYVLDFRGIDQSTYLKKLLCIASKYLFLLFRWDGQGVYALEVLSNKIFSRFRPKGVI